MILYHGTSARLLPRIMEEGLQPRENLPGALSRGNWAIMSGRDRVYLTSMYAGYFGMKAIEEEERGEIAIVEVDLPVDSPLLPDEDFLEQASRHDRPKGCPKKMENAVDWFRRNVTGFCGYWKDSLEHLGTVAHEGGIAPEFITRVSTFRPDYGMMSGGWLDPTITLINCRVMRRYYTALTRWSMGDPVTADDFEILPDSMEEARRLKRERTQATLDRSTPPVIRVCRLEPRKTG